MGQVLHGSAKDLTKMSSKSAVKLVVKGEGQGLLFKWVALLTGSKNALKGLGFFLGGFLLQALGFQWALWLMAIMLAAVLVLTLVMLKADLGKATQKIRGRELFSKTREINYLSAARIFLFASRDVWFVVGGPVYLYSVFGWSFEGIGTFMAAWVIGYGFVQAGAPKFLRRTEDAGSGAQAAKLWGSVLALLPDLIALGMAWSAGTATGADGQSGLAPVVLVGGLLVFGIVFTINSSVHSFLIVAYSDADKVALNVGFCYIANAVGRLGGTLLSGLVYQQAGLAACLWTSAALVALAVVFTLPLGGRRAVEEAAE